jgi:hypothetical protein
MEVLPEHMRSHAKSRNRRPRNAMTTDKKPVQPRIFLDASKMPRLLRQILQSLRRPKSSGIETVLLIDLKCDALTGRINWQLPHVFFSALLPPFVFSLPFHPPFLLTPFPQHIYLMHQYIS